MSLLKRAQECFDVGRIKLISRYEKQLSPIHYLLITCLSTQGKFTVRFGYNKGKCLHSKGS